MSELVAIAFGDQHTAFDARAAFARMQSDYLIEMEDIVVLTRDFEGKVKLHQAHNLSLDGAVGGAFWGMLIGLLFLNPLLGLGVGAGAGAIGGALSDIGINDDFMKNLGATLTPDSSAIFVLLRKTTFDKMKERLQGMDGTLLHTSLSKSSEDELRDVLDARAINPQEALSL